MKEKLNERFDEPEIVGAKRLAAETAVNPIGLEATKTLDPETIVRVYTALAQRWQESNPSFAGTFVCKLARMKYEQKDVIGAAAEVRRLETLAKQSDSAAWTKFTSSYILDIEEHVGGLIADFLERAEWNLEKGEQYRTRDGFYGMLGNPEKQAQKHYPATQFSFYTIF